VFAHVDHAAGAAEVGLPLRATDLLTFGNSKGGTPLMQLDQTMGIDLPLKVLIWQDQAASHGCPTIRAGLRSGTGSARTPSRPLVH
jgi:uncharacterized protein (DUF302 family)